QSAPEPSGPGNLPHSLHRSIVNSQRTAATSTPRAPAFGRGGARLPAPPDGVRRGLIGRCGREPALAELPRARRLAAGSPNDEAHAVDLDAVGLLRCHRCLPPSSKTPGSALPALNTS